ncbi:hypothetical protein H9P43_002470 [Blastocladiella emersonii ATCC 22665]|nr:hypothetical protein H9P43_002470 [Blastocladiella emersonii ATCC 22665]
MFARLSHRLYSTAAAAPQAAAKTAEQIVEVRVPYYVHRTKLAQQLPVYPKYRYKGTQVSTVVRRIEGNGKALALEIQQIHPKWTISYNRVSNHIEVKGNVVDPLRHLLTVKGF